MKRVRGEKTLLVGLLLFLVASCGLLLVLKPEQALSTGRRRWRVHGEAVGQAAPGGVLSWRLLRGGAVARRKGLMLDTPARGPSPALAGGNRSITVAVMTQTTSKGDWNGSYAGCTWRGQPLGCTYVARPSKELKRTADALWYHAPHVCAWHSEERAGPAQLAAVASMESATNYDCLNNPHFMGMFDLELSYRLASAVPLLYLRPDHVAAWQGDPLVPWGARLNNVAYMQSNCMAFSHRDKIVMNLMRYEDLAVYSYGRCLNNRPMPATATKLDVFRQHRFCLVMENSQEFDYTTEKLWDAFAAGCVPIFMGAPNIGDFLPDLDAIIDYQRLGTVAALRQELQRVGGSEAAWDAKVAWRRRPLRQLRPQFQRLVGLLGRQRTECQLCSILMDHRHGNTSLAEDHQRRWKWDPPNGREANLLFTSTGRFKVVHHKNATQGPAQAQR